MIRFPKPYVTQVIAYTADACTRKCPYCIQNHNYEMNYEEDIIVDVVNYFDANLVLNGKGETTLRPKRIESLYKRCPNIRRMFAYTNGDNEKVREELSKKFPKLKWVKTFCQESKDKTKHSDDRINTINSRNRMLVSPDTNLYNIDFDYFHPENEYILLSIPNIEKKYKGSILEKFLLENPDHIPQLVDISSFIYGHEIDCWCKKITIDDNCTFYKKFHDKNNLFKSRMDYIDDSYYRTLPIILSGKCNVHNGLHDEIIKSHPKYEEYLEYKNKISELYRNIYSIEDDIKNEKLPVVIEIREKFQNPIKWSASIENEEFDNRDHWYKKLFQSESFKKIDLSNIHNSTGLLEVTLIDNDLYSISIIGFNNDLVMLLSHPFKYNLSNKLFTKLFKYVFSKIT